jgi:two-component system nitrogen regulation sensor histidine kinase NtrY
MVVIALALVGTTALAVYLSGPKTLVSLASNILIFGLLSLNVVLILLLLFLVVRNLVKLLFERRKGIFGAKLRTKFVVAFVGFSVVPAVLLFLVAISYIGMSTDLWLSNQIEQSLQVSREIADALGQQRSQESLAFARHVSSSLARGEMGTRKALEGLKGIVEGKRREYQLDFLVIYAADMEPIAEAFSTRVSGELQSSVREAIPLRRVMRGQELTRQRKLATEEVIEGFVPLYSSYDPKDVAGVVGAGYLVPRTLGEQMAAISQTHEQYRQLVSQKGPIELNYYILLTVVLLVILFLSSWFGFYLAKQITIPLQALAEKTQDVALGRLDFQLDALARDEVGTLVESFNRMTQQLKKSQQALEASHRELERATLQSDQRRRYMEIVLRNIAAGVVSLDEENRITTVNRSAEQMLGIRWDRVVQRPLEEIIDGEQAALVRSLVDDLRRSGKESLQQEIHTRLGGRVLDLEANITLLRDDEGGYLGMVVVLDDLTERLKAQRMMAWKEVARRIAHEIKNPLTPIKLSAERLRKRYLPGLGEDGGVLNECTDTIVEQVDHLQELVSEFQRFARMPEAHPVPQDLNQIVQDVLVLYRENHPAVKVQAELAGEVPVVPLDREQIQRVLINLLNNALAALPEEGGRIQIRTGYNKALRVVRLEIADNGPGIPPSDKGRLFEPYFSTKEAGTGLGLTIVRSIIMDHRGYIRVMDNEPRGTRFVIELPL